MKAAAMNATAPPTDSIQEAFDRLIRDHAPRLATEPCACGYCWQSVPALAIGLAYNYALRNELRPDRIAGNDALDELEGARDLLNLLIERMKEPGSDYMARRALTPATWQPLWDEAKKRLP